MFSSIIHRSVAALALMLILAGRSYATVAFFAGAETADNNELAIQGGFLQQGGNITASSTWVHSGGQSWAVSAPSGSLHIFSGITVSANATYALDEYINITSATSGLVSNALAINAMTSSTNQVVVNLKTPGGVPTLELYNTTGATAIGTATIAYGTAYRLVLEATASASVGEYKMLVCTVPADSCTTVDSGASLNTGTAGWTTVYPVNIDSHGVSDAITINYDDVLVQTGASDPGPHQVLARQFTTTASTYNGWTAFGGSGCPANWDQSPFGTTQDCNSSTTGSSTCALGASACQTGVTDFSKTTGQGSTGFGAQVITGQTINAAKIGWVGQKNVADTNPDFAVFIDSVAAETDITGIAYASPPQTNSYQEVYLASAPAASKILGAQAGIKHATTGSVRHDVYAVWLMADVAIPAASGNVGTVMVP